MAGETSITVIGNATADAELRFTPNGHAVANWTIASTPRRYDKQANEWVDQEALFLRCSVWRQHAENVAETITKGMRLVVVGDLVQRSFETKEGEKRTVVELEVEEVAPSLRWATATVTRTPRGGGGGFGGSSGASSTPSGGQDNDPWATDGGQSSGGGFSNEPPF